MISLKTVLLLLTLGTPVVAGPVTAVDTFDLQKYLGRWYEIERIPNRFERDCVGVTADYSLRDDGKVQVINTCRKETLNGKSKQASGVARVEEGAKLSVTFTPWLPFIRGDYWVIYLNDDYTVAVVGEPDRKFGWLLSRTPSIDEATRSNAHQAMVENGYDPTKFMTVLQAKE